MYNNLVFRNDTRPFSPLNSHIQALSKGETMNNSNIFKGYCTELTQFLFEMPRLKLFVIVVNDLIDDHYFSKERIRI